MQIFLIRFGQALDFFCDLQLVYIRKIFHTLYLRVNSGGNVSTRHCGLRAAIHYLISP
jgi:hypothetical protein